MTLEKWQQFNLWEQLGNIGSEISRAWYWEEKGNETSRQNSLERALELINLTLTDSRHLGRLKEVARLQEVVADIWAKTGIYHLTLKELKDYLTPFAWLARV